MFATDARQGEYILDAEIELLTRSISLHSTLKQKLAAELGVRIRLHRNLTPRRVHRRAGDAVIVGGEPVERAESLKFFDEERFTVAGTHAH